jgi:hypothetical protein
MLNKELILMSIQIQTVSKVKFGGANGKTERRHILTKDREGKEPRSAAFQ